MVRKREEKMPQAKRTINGVMRRSWNALPKGLQTNLRPLVPVNQSQTVTKTTPTVETPLLSVIVPVYNVRKYVEKCLESLLSQDYKNLEVIVVDDGSTDGSDQVIEAYLARHKRMRMIRLSHAGNGAARNAGIRAAKGEYLTFVDSDDIVEPGAYMSMVSQLRASGSDFVVGAFMRQKGSKKWLPQMMSDLHSEDRVGINVNDFPEILRDVFLWNKVFRREFWDSFVGEIPEGVLYEDQETIVRAFLRARTFDVLKKVVYTWRIREDNSSITQQKGDLTDLIDRMRAALIVTDLVVREGSTETKTAWFVKSLGEDLRLYIEQVPRVGADYWTVLQSAVQRLHSVSGTEVLSLLPIDERVLVYLIAADRRDDLESVLVSFRDNGRTFPVQVDGSVLRAVPRYASELATPVPGELLQFQPVDVSINTRLLDISWSGSDTLEIKGVAYISGIDASVHAYKTELELVNTTTGHRIAIPSTPSPDRWIDQVSGDRWNSYAECVFHSSISTSELLAINGKITPNGQEWSLVATVDAAGISRTDVIRVRDGERLPFQLPTGPASRGSRIVAQIDRNRGLRLRVIRYGSMASRVSSVGRTIKFEFDGVAGEAPSQLTLKSGDEELTSSVFDASGVRVFSVELPLPNTNQRDVLWDVYGYKGAGKPHMVGWPGASTDGSDLPSPDGPLNVLPTGYGYLRVNVRTWRVTASECIVDHDRGAIVIRGRSAYIKPGNELMLDLILATSRSYILPEQISFTPGTDAYTAVFPLFADKWGYGKVAPETGHYKLYTRSIDEAGTVRRHSVKAAGRLADAVPIEDLTDKLRVVLTAEDRERSFVIKILAPYQFDERGPFAQQQLRDRHLSDEVQIAHDAILFESFMGKSATDSVRAISDELGRTYPACERYWTIADYSVPVPDGCTPVLIYSAEWYRILNSAKMLVNNNNFPHYFRKRQGQFYVQTWHGTPLKKIGNHTPVANLTASYRRLMQREAASWDLLLAQNAFAGSTLPDAFGFSGKTLTEGYPRNDLMYDEQSSDRRTGVRKALGLADDTLAILYMPTWRDNVRTAQNKFDAVNFLDFEKIEAEFGSACAVLSRGHHNVAGQRKVAQRSTFIDVTNFPEVADLYLAADLLITDYSSSMFDYCGTRKPVLFLAPDIELYQNKTRGFYFDFQSEAPGPIVSSTSEVIEAIYKLDDLASDYREKYGAFVAKYVSLDDGLAAKRVVGHLPLNSMDC